MTSKAEFAKSHHAAMQAHPGSRALIVRKTRASLSESGLFTFEKWVLGDGHPLTASGANRQFRQSYRYENGSEIIVGGMGQ